MADFNITFANGTFVNTVVVTEQNIDHCTNLLAPTEATISPGLFPFPDHTFVAQVILSCANGQYEAHFNTPDNKKGTPGYVKLELVDPDPDDTKINVEAIEPIHHVGEVNGHEVSYLIRPMVTSKSTNSITFQFQVSFTEVEY